MPWFKVDDKLHSHPKVVAARLEAMGLWLLAGTYCADNHTDGVIAWPEIERLAGGKAAAKRLAKVLVEAKGRSHIGLWEYVENGCRFHDWADYQPSAAEVLARLSGLSAKRSAAGQKGAQKRWQEAASDDGKTMAIAIPDDGKADSKRDGKTMAVAIPNDGNRIAPIPDPDPNKSPQPPLPEAWELPGHETDAWARGISDATARPCSAPDGPTAKAAIHRAVQTHCPLVATPADRARWIRARAREYALAHPGVLLTAFNFEAHLNSPRRAAPPSAPETPERPYHRAAKLYERAPATLIDYERTGAAALAKAVSSPTVASVEKDVVSS